LLFQQLLGKIWPFFIFEDLAFLKLLKIKFGLFIFFDLATLPCQERMCKEGLSGVGTKVLRSVETYGKQSEIQFDLIISRAF